MGGIPSALRVGLICTAKSFDSGLSNGKISVSAISNENNGVGPKKSDHQHM